MGIFNRKKKEESEPDIVQTNSFTDIMNGLQFAVNSVTKQYTKTLFRKNSPTDEITA